MTPIQPMTAVNARILTRVTVKAYAVCPGHQVSKTNKEMPDSAFLAAGRISMARKGRRTSIVRSQVGLMKEFRALHDPHQ